MPIDRTRRAAPLVLTTALAAFGSAPGCHGAEQPAAAPAEPSPAAPASAGTMPPGPASPPSAPEPAQPQPIAANAPQAVATPASASQPTTPNPKPAPAACGRAPGEKIEKLHWSYGPNAECDRLETLWANVPHADLVCKTDDDCTVVTSDGNCINLPLSKAAAARKEYSKPPCGNPVSGACAGHPNVPKCSGGCCGVK